MALIGKIVESVEKIALIKKEEEIREGITYKCRSNIKKEEKQGSK